MLRNVEVLMLGLVCFLCCAEYKTYFSSTCKILAYR